MFWFPPPISNNTKKEQKLDACNSCTFIHTFSKLKSWKCCCECHNPISSFFLDEKNNED